MKNWRVRILALLLAVFLLPASPAIAAAPPASVDWERADQFIANTAQFYRDHTGDTQDWLGFDLALYDLYAENQTPTMSAAMSRSIINAAIDELTKAAPDPGQLVKYALVLKGMGIDPDQLTDKNGSSLKTSEVFAAPSPDSENYIYSAPFFLAAHANGLITLEDLDAVFSKIEALQAGGLFPDFGYPVYNVTGQIITALALFLDDADYGVRAQAIINTSLAALSAAQAEDGSFEGAYNEGWVLAGLAANGAALAPDFTGSKGDLLAALLAEGNVAQNGAGFVSPWAGGSDASAYDTAHGLIGLLAEGMRRKGETARYNCLDLTERGSRSASYYTPPTAPPADGDGSAKQITITFSLQGLDENGAPDLWVDGRSVSIADRETASSAIVKAFRSLDGYTQTGAASGYVSTVVSPTRTLTEKQSPWPNSGWMYLVNGDAPSTGIASYRLSEGDDLLLYFSTDYTTEDAPAEAAEPQLDTISFSDLAKDGWYLDGVSFVLSHGYMTGISDTAFAPEDSLTRGMAATILYRIAGEPETTGALTYTDAENGQWYSSALLWAQATGLATGYGNGVFGLEDALTCEQIAVMLHRFAALQALDTTTAASAAPDGTSDWAKTAMSWASGLGLYDALGDTVLTPQSLITRAQLAVSLLRWTELA